MVDFEKLQQQVNKRLSLNLLIQGAASHAYLTGHHLVKDELDSISRGLIPLYDKMSVNIQLAQWMSDLVFIVGFPKKFWRTIAEPEHPFSKHSFLVKHGRDLAYDSKRHTIQYAKKRWVPWLPGLQFAHTHWLLMRTVMKEWNRWRELEAISKTAISRMWKIEEDRLHPRISSSVKFGNLQPNPSSSGKILQDAASGYSGVEHIDGQFKVVARAWMFPLLIHELTKGTAELVCIHGLNHLDDFTYNYVIREADKIEYEIWMMQAGGSVWRKLLNVKPKDLPLAETLMHIARLEPEELECFLFDLVEHPMTAKATIADWFE